MDQTGVIYSASADASSTFPTPYVFRGALATSTLVSNPPIGETYAEGHFSGILALMNSLFDEGFIPTEASLAENDDFNIQVAQGFYLKASYGENPDTLAKNLQLILSADALKGKTDMIEYVDLRFGNRVYYKLKGQPQNAQAPTT